MLLGIPGKLGNAQISLQVGKKLGIWLIITEIREKTCFFFSQYLLKYSLTREETYFWLSGCR